MSQIAGQFRGTIEIAEDGTVRASLSLRGAILDPEPLLLDDDGMPLTDEIEISLTPY